jgi:transmembrane sensor
MSGQIVAQSAALWCMRVAEGPLPLGEQLEFERWLHANPRHQVAFEEAVATWREFDGSEQGELVTHRFEALQAMRRRRRRWNLTGGIPRAAVASVVVVVLGAAALHAYFQPEIYATDVGERRAFVLKDGSKVSLDADTRVEVQFRGHGRALYLDHGRARFAVARDPLRPFSVAAAGKTVVAVGTDFSVEVIGQQLHVVLYEGHVAVLGKPTANGSSQPLSLAASNTGAVLPADQVLIPGHELVAQANTEVATVSTTDTARTLAWEDGQLVFVDEPLADAIERINRYADNKISVGDAKAARIQITGVFATGDVEAFVEGVTAAFPVRATLQGTRTVLVSERPKDER